MTRFRGDKNAFGAPGIDPKWARGNKDGVGTAYSSESEIWYSIWHGTLTEVYYPTVDRPQIRDMEYLISDGKSFFHEEKRHLNVKTERLSHHDLGYRIKNSDPMGRYTITKEIISDPHLPCVLQRTKLEGDEKFLSTIHLYLLCAPHLDGGGANNNGYVANVSGRDIFLAEKNGTWLALGTSATFVKLSCGYVGKSDGWTDLHNDYTMDWEFDTALNGNIALTGEIDVGRTREFTVGLALGNSMQSAITVLFQSLGVPFEENKSRFLEQWDRPFPKILPLEWTSGDRGNMYHASYSLLQAHEDKMYPGAIIASLSIPWGESKGDEDKGGYHLVWTRDMINSATALLAARDIETPLRALIYLATIQQEDGGFPQNSWINGKRYWGGIQLDEVAFPIILAWKMHEEKALSDFDPYVMVLRAARYLVVNGPATQQERWEEASGYSPSTLASNIAALICAACFARDRGDVVTAQFLEEYADFLECHIERWTCTTRGTLVPGISKHYIRILPVSVNDPQPDENPDTAVISLANQPPRTQNSFPAKDIVDAGFLELVRYGIRSPTDSTITDSLKVVDSVLKVETPYGPCWHRYNHDGYGQREDGGPYIGWGKGRAWPLLTGERGHYEIAAKRGAKSYIDTMEKFASETGLLPEQVWDEEDRPKIHMCLGRPTGSATPLMWAHAEYIKLLRSQSDDRVFDFIPEVGARYLLDRTHCKKIEVWKSNRQPRSVERGTILRIQAPAEFLLHWSSDNWKTIKDNVSINTALQIEFVDIFVAKDQVDPVRFTFFWKSDGRWDGRDYSIEVK
ncbi:MAG: glucan 1,4-alpha-glucosidase [Nitrososphaerota archaeon]|nr:glucan 1,4-alpha-glucosidase [Nitrososphaerota archaeon]